MRFLQLKELFKKKMQTFFILQKKVSDKGMDNGFSRVSFYFRFILGLKQGFMGPVVIIFY